MSSVLLLKRTVKLQFRLVAMQPSGTWVPAVLWALLAITIPTFARTLLEEATYKPGIGRIFVGNDSVPTRRLEEEVYIAGPGRVFGDSNVTDNRRVLQGGVRGYYDGNDINYTPTGCAANGSPTAAGCKLLCLTEPKCRAFTWVEKIDNCKNSCYLKTPGAPFVPDDRFASGTITDGEASQMGLFLGNDLPGMYDANSDCSLQLAGDVRECYENCRKEPACGSYTFIKEESGKCPHSCYLKRGVAPLQPFWYGVSGTVRPEGGANVEPTTLRQPISFTPPPPPPPPSADGQGGSCDDATATLAAINALRSEFTDTPPLTWDPALAFQAQSWAEELRARRCIARYSPDLSYGEAIASGSGTSGAPTCSEAVGAWRALKGQVDFSDLITTAERIRSNGLLVGDFTQVIWKGSTTVGCGIGNCGDTRVVVCQFKPPGNLLGRANNFARFRENVGQPK